MDESSKPLRPSRSPSTQLIHHPYTPPEGFASPATPVAKGSTIFFPSMEAVRQRDWAFKTTYTYGLHGTPTSFVLEERLAALEGAKHCILAPSGLAALNMVNLALLKPGGRVLLPDNVYGPNKYFAEHFLQSYGIEHAVYDPLDAQDLAQKLTPNTQLVWLEAAGSVTLEFPDLQGLIRVCNQAKVPCALDNTWGAGLAFSPFDLRDQDGCALQLDISVHALTKYPSGGGDVLMGSVCTQNPELHKTLKRCHMQLGFGVGMNDVEAILRALPSIELRYTAQDRSAQQLARFLAQHPAVAQVRHPALPCSPGHVYWQRLCGHKPHSQAAGLVSFFPHASWSDAQVDAFCEALQWFKIGYSWGGPVSLVMAYDLRGDRDLAVSMESAPSKRLLRLCIGLENPDDLQADLAQALETIHRQANAS
ncbi:cystathionine beta-lyase [Lampropedia puyangensis]|uniref:Cystathionine beta-lyase n=1 Tax=Lampropedia puyangensis TaxID=1330072 RepID=A0A4S8F3D9_9BURK|nr:PLP-dependent transferase [Lampropedia puyangensis]THT99671.1 cystathionine beta-lyase [Lampropedia puyangensis]